VLLLRGGPNYLGDLVGLCIVLLVQGACAWILWRDLAIPQLLRRALPWALGISAGIIVWGFLMRFHRISRFFPAWCNSWGRGTAIVWAFLSVLLIGAWAVSRLFLRVRSEHSPGRRAFLRTTQGALMGIPAVATGYGVFVDRFRISLREQNIVLPGLPADLHGLRIAQLTDIHLSPFLSEKELAYAVDLANDTRPHLTLVTGDLITSFGDPLDACLAQLARLRADAGLFGCNGNHEIYTGTQEYVEQKGARLGLHILRARSQRLRFGNATLNLAGVDYQRSGKPYLKGSETLVAPGAVNILLSHNPDVFPVAAAKGYQLTVAGHTHGGQVRVEILGQDLNVARFFTPYVDGLYRRDNSAIFVSRGIGTIALPARIGAPPEVALLKLCRS
jgi:predicted MPP superfamily phosphohydrolase